MGVFQPAQKATTILSPSDNEPPFDFIASATRTFTEHGLNFPYWFDLAFERGVLYKSDRFLLCAVPTEDTWVIVWAQKHPKVALGPLKLVAEAMKKAPFPLPKVAWARGLRGRFELTYYSWDRLIRLTERTAHASS